MRSRGWYSVCWAPSSGSVSSALNCFANELAPAHAAARCTRRRHAPAPSRAAPGERRVRGAAAVSRWLAPRVPEARREERGEAEVEATEAQLTAAAARLDEALRAARPILLGGGPRAGIGRERRSGRERPRRGRRLRRNGIIGGGGRLALGSSHAAEHAEHGAGDAADVRQNRASPKSRGRLRHPRRRRQPGAAAAEWERTRNVLRGSHTAGTRSCPCPQTPRSTVCRP